jgi:hypothetical protein
MAEMRNAQQSFLRQLEGRLQLERDIVVDSIILQIALMGFG